MAEQPAGAGALDRFLTAIEVLGNKVPHPAIIFFWLIGIVIALSAIFGLLGTSVTYEGYDYDLGDHRRADDRGAQPAVGRRHPLHGHLAGGELHGLRRRRRDHRGDGGRGSRRAVGAGRDAGEADRARRAALDLHLHRRDARGVSSIAADAGYLVLVPLGPRPSTASAAIRSRASRPPSPASRASFSSTSSSRRPTRCWWR
jgi:aminobenzoyl-glutamate transport protein